jgi:tRNA G18 (ribose-2'-O)-methylase SpoU
MGSTLRIPSLEHVSIEEIHSHIQKASYTLVASDMESNEKKSILYTDFDWKLPRALLLGQEGQGFSAAWAPFAENYVHIPMQPPVESLNVAAAAAVILYEARRHRGTFTPS